MATNAATYSSTRSTPLLALPATTAKKRGIPTWRLLDSNTQQDLLAVLTQMIGHHVPRSCATDQKGVPDESH
jgi:hypothetical protein